MLPADKTMAASQPQFQVVRQLMPYLWNTQVLQLLQLPMWLQVLT
ncbi:MAG: hypothetical protein R2847_03500 [Bacteroidia bacterium]